MTQKIIAIVNPCAAAGKTRKHWPEIRARLTSGLGIINEVFTEYQGHGIELARQAIANGYELIIAVGGDGTLGEVANGFFAKGKPTAASVSLGYVPQGTGGDFARTLGLKTWQQACDRLIAEESRQIDVGYVEFLNHDNRQDSRIFINVASFGCGGAVARTVQISGKRFGGRLAFALATVKTLLRYRDQPVTFSCDDGEQEQLSITNLAVCNARFFGGGMQVAPAAQVDDGVFDMTLWAGFGLKDFALQQRKLYNGEHIHHSKTRTSTVRCLQASSNSVVQLEVDGENTGTLPATFWILPQALTVRF